MIFVSFTNVVYDFFSQVTGALCPKEMALDSRAGICGGLASVTDTVVFRVDAVDGNFIEDIILSEDGDANLTEFLAGAVGVSTVTADQIVELEDSTSFGQETPDWIYFASGGGLDRQAPLTLFVDGAPGAADTSFGNAGTAISSRSVPAMSSGPGPSRRACRPIREMAASKRRPGKAWTSKWPFCPTSSAPMSGPKDYSGERERCPIHGGGRRPSRQKRSARSAWSAWRRARCGMCGIIG